MKKAIFCIVLACLTITQVSCVSEKQTADEHLLWPDGIKDNPITYAQPNTMKNHSAPAGAPLKTCRVYSNIETPQYYIYQPAPDKNTGVAMVVLPGGGYESIWLDTEGHNMGLYFAERGITSLVLKYRTNTKDKDGKQQMTQEKYVPIAVTDAKEALRILHSRADDLNIDPDKIGIGGFSAGGHLTVSVCFDPAERDPQTYPDFAFLVYPWFEDFHEKQISTTKNLPPMFIVNGQEDTVTPPVMCVSFYETLCKNKVPAELHIYSKGGHGFTLGLASGKSTIQWKNSFVQWLEDIKMITD